MCGQIVHESFRFRFFFFFLLGTPEVSFFTSVPFGVSGFVHLLTDSTNDKANNEDPYYSDEIYDVLFSFYCHKTKGENRTNRKSRILYSLRALMARIECVSISFR